MTLLERAVRRILVRNLDRIISTVGHNAAYELTDYKPSLPTIGKLISNVIWFAVLTFSISSIFALFNIQLLAYITPILFIGRIFRPLVYNYIYGQKQEPVLVQDRRFRSGARIDGYRWVKDKDKKYDFTPEQIKISRAEGLIKLAIMGLVIFNVHSTMTSVKHRQNNLSQEQVLALLQVGDTVIAKYNNAVEVFIKVKETSYHTNYKRKREVNYNSIYFEPVFTDSLKNLGLFIAKDTSTVSLSSIYSYISISPFHANGWSFSNKRDTLLEKETIRIDTLFYVESSNITVSPSKLPPIPPLIVFNLFKP